MSSKYIYEQYKSLLPFYANQTERYYPNGHDAIRVHLKGGKQYIFKCGKNGEISLMEPNKKGK